MNELKLSIARELAQQAFGDATAARDPRAQAEDGVDSKVLNQKLLISARQTRSARTIADPQTRLVYSAAMERQCVTSIKIDQIVPALSSLANDDRCSMHTLVVRTIRRVQVLPVMEQCLLVLFICWSV